LSEKEIIWQQKLLSAVDFFSNNAKCVPEKRTKRAAKGITSTLMDKLLAERHKEIKGFDVSSTE